MSAEVPAPARETAGMVGAVLGSLDVVHGAGARVDPKT